MGLILLAGYVIAQVTIFDINTIRSDRPILGLRFEGRQLVRFSSNDARGQVEDLVQARETHTLTVQAADYRGNITLRQLGAKASPARVYGELVRAGREGNFFNRLLTQVRASVGAVNVTLTTPLDSKLVADYVASIDKQIAKEPTNAYFVWDGQKAVVQPDKQGIVVNAELAARILQYANARLAGPINLPTKPTTASLTTLILESRLAEVRNIAQKPLVVGAGESKLVLDQSQLVAMTVPKLVPDSKDPSKQVLQLSFDEAKVKGIADEVLKSVVVAPTPTIISSSGAVVRQGSPGRQAGHDAPADLLAALIARQAGASMPDQVNIPLVALEPPIVRQKAQAAVRARTGTGSVRLTFDDGPGAYTPQILDILKRYNVHATFYVVGRNVPRYTAQMQRIKSEGHTLCNHSYNHADLARLSRARMSKELSDTQNQIQQATGITPNCMRPPYGSQNATVREVAAGLGLSVDMWSVDPRDWAQPGSVAIKSRVLSEVGPGAVVLLHVLNQQTVDALPGIIEGIRGAGYALE